MQQKVEIEIVVRVRDSDGKILGEGAKIKASTDYMDPVGSSNGTIMVLRQRRMIAEGIKDMGMDFVKGHFLDRFVQRLRGYKNT